MNQESKLRRRLELTRLIREENQSNRRKVRAREEVLYGRTEDPEEYESLWITESSPGEEEGTSSFGLRFLVAIFLFAVYFICKTREIDVMGVTADQMETAVAGDDALTRMLTDAGITEFLKDLPEMLAAK